MPCSHPTPLLPPPPPPPHPSQKRASKSTYGRRRPGEEEATEADEAPSKSGGGAHAATAADEETEDEGASWLAGDEAGHSYRSTTQTSSGRISRPPRKNAPGSPVHTPASRAAARGKGPAAASSATAATATAAAAAASSSAAAMSRTPSGGSITAGVWGGVGVGLSGLTVKIPSLAARDEHDLFAADGVTALGAGEAPSQTPTSVADLYPVGAMGVGDDPFGKYGPAHYHRSRASTSATSSAASSLSPGREHQLLGGEGEGEDAAGPVGVSVGLEEGMEYGCMDDDLSKLQALAGRVAPEWAEALNEALGALEGVAANGQPHHTHDGAGALYALPLPLAPAQHHSHTHGGLGPVVVATAAAGGGRRTGVGRHGSIGSLTDSQAESSATGSYLPSSSDSDGDGGHSSGSEAAAPVPVVPCPPGRFLVGEEEEDADETLDLLQPSAKRARLAAAAPTSPVGGKAGTAAAAVVEEEDYGYFTTEEELMDQMLHQMLGTPGEGVGGVGVSSVGDARWGLADD